MLSRPSGLLGGGGFDVEQVARVVSEALAGFAVEVPGHIDTGVLEFEDLVGMRRGCGYADLRQELLHPLDRDQVGCVIARREHHEFDSGIKTKPAPELGVEGVAWRRAQERRGHPARMVNAIRNQTFNT